MSRVERCGAGSGPLNPSLMQNEPFRLIDQSNLGSRDDRFRGDLSQRTHSVRIKLCLRRNHRSRSERETEGRVRKQTRRVCTTARHAPWPEFKKSLGPHISRQGGLHFLKHPFVTRGVEVAVVSKKTVIENVLEQTGSLSAHHWIARNRLEAPVRSISRKHLDLPLPLRVVGVTVRINFRRQIIKPPLFACALCIFHPEQRRRCNR